MDKIIVRNLYKDYKVANVRIKGLKPLNLKLDTNEFVILRGENGSGKTTFMKIMATLIKPTGGTVEILGESLKNPKLLRRKIGYIPETVNLDLDQNALKFWQLYASLSGRNTADYSLFIDYLKLLRLEKWVETPIQAYSLGMKKRLLLAFWLSLKPELLLLDEFESGLDQEGKQKVFDFMSNIDGLTIIAVSHNQDFSLGKHTREINFRDLLEAE